MGLDRISDILGVRYLLNGSIRRAGEQVRVTATLVDDTGYQVWSETFDGELKGIFGFQSDIAEKVASEITRELVVLESPVAAQVTDSPEAYRYYLIGREYLNRRPPNWAANAAEAYRHSIAADPSYAPPYAGLSMALMMGASNMPPKTTFLEAESLIEQALSLDPMLAEAWMAKGLPNVGNPKFDAHQAIMDLEYALELNPNLVTAYNWLAISLSKIGDIEGMIRTRERGLAVDPLHPVLLMNSADVYLARNDFEGWKQQLLRLLDLPEPPSFLSAILSRKHQEYGFLPEALRWAKELVRINIATGATPNLPKLILLYESLGMNESADYWLDRYEIHAGDLADFRLTRIDLLNSRGLFDEIDMDMDWLLDEWSIDVNDPSSDYIESLGFLLSLRGEYETAIPLLKRSLNLDEPVRMRGGNPDDIFTLHLLAFDYAQIGQDERVDAILDRAEQISRNMFALGNFLSHPDNQLAPAIIHAARGDLAGGAQALRTAFGAGWRNYYSERHFPPWRGAWQSEEFAPVVEDIVAALEQQRAEVEAIEAEKDFRLEFELLITKEHHQPVRP